MFWKLEEARLKQYRGLGSAANADNVDYSSSPVPDGKVWVVLAFLYYPSVNETKIINIRKVSPSGYQFSLLNPISLSLNPATATFIEQGMEYILFPGDYILVSRDSHTAGSTMITAMEFIEIDLPLYTYDEPQEVKRQARVRSSLLSRLGGVTGGGSVRGTTLTGPDRSGRGGPLEK